MSLEHKGCLGLGYRLSFCPLNDKNPVDRLVCDKEVKFIVDGKVLEYLSGTKIDYIDDEIDSRFVYINPHAKAIFA